MLSARADANPSTFYWRINHLPLEHKCQQYWYNFVFKAMACSKLIERYNMFYSNLTAYALHFIMPLKIYHVPRWIQVMHKKAVCYIARKMWNQLLLDLRKPGAFMMKKNYLVCSNNIKLQCNRFLSLRKLVQF